MVAGWLEGHASALVETDEILGYHFEQACRYRRELGQPAAETLTAPARADSDRRSARAHAAGRRCRRQPVGAGGGSPHRRRHRRHYHGRPGGHALFFAGRLEDACGSLLAVAESAARAGERTAELVALIKERQLRMDVAPEGIADELDSLIAAALPILEAGNDDFGRDVAHYASSVAAHQRGWMDAELTALENSVRHARRAALSYYGGWTFGSLATSRLRGPRPVSELLGWIDVQAASTLRDPYIRAFRSIALTMCGHFEEARTLLDVRSHGACRSGRQLFFSSGRQAARWGLSWS